jgi:DNA-binding NtrC family response regulator
VLVLSVVAHAETALLGRRLVIDDEQPVVLGRAARCFDAGVLDDRQISREHLRLERRGDGLVATDLGSHNGTCINGARIRAPTMLAAGDVLALGSVVLLLHRGAREAVLGVGGDIVAVSAAMAHVLRQVGQVAPENVTVLVAGPTGVGKEVVAREIHRRSGRTGSFVAVNCAAVADGVLQSELFGHARGAFSSAVQERSGLVEAARGGTLFLDEIGDASPALQASLLRLLEQREYRRVGDDRIQTTDARFVAATHVVLEDAVSASRFREDLLSRIGRWRIEVPPLAERPDDIVPLAMGFARRAAGREVRLSPELTLALLRYAWPQNVRELQAVVEQAVIEAEGAEMLGLGTTLEARLAGTTARREPSGGATGLAAGGARPSREALEAAFHRADGNVRRLAKHLGVNRATVYRWASELGLDLAKLRALKR